eukprot:1892473-Amphidinium_carterae.1
MHPPQGHVASPSVVWVHCSEQGVMPMMGDCVMVRVCAENFILISLIVAFLAGMCPEKKVMVLGK